MRSRPPLHDRRRPVIARGRGSRVASALAAATLVTAAAGCGGDGSQSAARSRGDGSPVQIHAGQVTFTLYPAVARRLRDAKVVFAGGGRARGRADTGGAITLPVLTGELDRSALLGRVRLGGSLVLRSPRGRVEVQQLRLDTARRSLTGLLGAVRKPVLELRGATPQRGAGRAGEVTVRASFAATLHSEAQRFLCSGLETDVLGVGGDLGRLRLLARGGSAAR